MFGQPCTGFYQLAYVTSDLDRAGPGRAGRDRVRVEGFDTFEVNLELDNGDHTVIGGALTFVGFLQLELVEPRGGSDEICRGALPPDGSFHPGFHHVGSLVDSAPPRGGHQVALSGRNPGVARFFHADARPHSATTGVLLPGNP